MKLNDELEKHAKPKEGIYEEVLAYNIEYWYIVFFLHLLNMKLLKITCVNILIYWIINLRNKSIITML